MLDSRWASIDAFAENNRDNILRDITRLVAVPSVEGTPEPGAPFGKGPRAALDKALEIAAELGLDTHNAEGYIGWAQTGPIADGQKYLATITHTDVVPEGNGWDADPYTVRVRDGWLLEENEEAWNDVPCRRLTVDQSGTQNGKIVSTVWLRQEDGTPLRGEISVEGEIILTAEFTSFAFYDTIDEQGNAP